jgi:hypothetical protein
MPHFRSWCPLEGRQTFCIPDPRLSGVTTQNNSNERDHIMWNNRRLRLFGALFAFALVATACGSDATTTEAADAGQTDDNVMSETQDDEINDHDDDDDEHANGASTIDVDVSRPIPEVAITLNETGDPGVFDMKVVLANFTITPDAVDGDPVDNEGHMHLLIDGEKIERFYELERQVNVPEGDHLVEVELNANNHTPYSIDGVSIRTGMTVVGAGMAEHDADGEHSNEDGTDAIEEGLDSADANVTITASLEGGTVSLEGDDRVEVGVDDVVMIMITADVDEEAHLHGYDISASVTPGESSMILFTADTPGRFEIEFENSGVFIAELEVS